MSTGEKVRMLRLKAELSQRELAKIAGTSHNTIARIESGAQPNPPVKILKAIAEKFRVSLEDLVDPKVSVSEILASVERPRKRPKAKIEEVPLRNLVRIPVVAYVPCGMPTEIPEDMVMDYISLPLDWVRDKDAFAVIARGNSMIGHGIMEGDYVVVSRNIDPRSGSIALVELNGEVTIKKIFFKDDQVVLQPANSQYEPILVTDRDQFRIIGKVVFSGRKHE